MAGLLAAVAVALALAALVAPEPAAGDAPQVRRRLPRSSQVTPGPAARRPPAPKVELEPFPEIPETASVEESLAILKERLERVHRTLRAAAGGPA